MIIDANYYYYYYNMAAVFAVEDMLYFYLRKLMVI